MSLTLVAVFLSGMAAGFINVLAGGGSLITLPILVFAGLPMPVANGTNRVSILCQNVVATTKFHRLGVLSLREALVLAVPATVGSVAGTFLAVELDPKVLQVVIAVIISVMAFFLVFRPAMWENERRRDLPKAAVVLIFFAIGVYGGFVQAGVGFIFLWILSGVVGHDLIHANALKVTVVLAYTAVSLIIFLSNGLVHLPVGITLASGSMIGGYLGARFSVARGNRWVRIILACAVTASAVKMLFQALG